MPPAGIIQTEMDEETRLELEIQQELDRINLDNDDFAADDDNDDYNIDEIPDVDASIDQDGGVVPAEMQIYLDTIQKQRLEFEAELEGCDALLDSAIASARGEKDAVMTERAKSLVPPEEWQALEEGAALEGMTVDEYRKKLLQDMEDEPFKLEEMDFIADDSEFILPQTSLDQAFRALQEEESSSTALVPLNTLRNQLSNSQDEEMIEKALVLARRLQKEDERKSRLEMMSEDERKSRLEMAPLAIENGYASDEERQSRLELSPPAIENGGLSEDERKSRLERALEIVRPSVEDQEGANDDELQLVPVGLPDQEAEGEEDGDRMLVPVGDGDVRTDGQNVAGGKAGTIAVVRKNPLLEFEQYLREQFQQVDERFKKREDQLKKELESRRQVEDELMLALEERKLRAMQTMQHEEQQLVINKQELQRKTDIETEIRQERLQVDLKNCEETIATLTAQLDEDRYQLEKIDKAEAERKAERCADAATTIQRHYKGYSTRKLYAEDVATLAEKKEWRREEKQRLRIDEINQEIDQRKAEKAKKDEAARQAKEEEEGKIAEEKRKKEEEKRRKKEEEEQRKQEAAEKKKQEEEEKKRRKEEEKRAKEEEKRKKKEEEERKKREAEEEKQRRKEEEERKKKEQEEEKSRLSLEKKAREEEEERARLEDKRRQEAEETERKRKEEEEEERKRKEEEDRKTREEEEEARKRQEGEEEEGEEKRSEPDPALLEKKVPSSVIGNTGHSETSVSHPAATDNATLQESDHGNTLSPAPVTFDLEPNTNTNSDTDANMDTNTNTMTNTLPESLESRRLAWMKACLPWSKTSNEPYKAKSEKEKQHRRPASAKKLTPLPESAILEAAQVASLRQVTTVELHDLPGHALSPLGQCAGLKHLKVTGCRLIALDGLAHCKQLQCIDAQDNLIEYVDLKEMTSLYTLNLSHNKLSSVHGLTGCNNLRWLDVSHNRLTKLAGLSPLRRLHTLQASDNQLVTTAGLELCPSMQQLDVSANYLKRVEGLDRLALLGSLNAASNNLTQVPAFENNVLLQEVVLRENSIGPDLDLSAAWLPLLAHLDLSQNVIEELKGTAAGLFVLKRLDLAVNQITEVGSFVPALSACPRLEDLSLLGNAVLDEECYRDSVKQAVPCVVSLDGAALRSQADALVSNRSVTTFHMMCVTQLQLHRDIKQTLHKDCRLSSASARKDSGHVCDAYFRFCDRSFKMAVEHRYAHEYGELSSACLPSAPQTPRSARPNSGRSPKISTQARSTVLSVSQSLQNSPEEKKEEAMMGSSRSDTTAASNDGRIVSNPASAKTEHDSLGMQLQTGGGGTTAIVNPRDTLAPALSEKEKFELALGGGAVETVKQRETPAPVLSEKEKFELALRGGAGAGEGGAVTQDRDAQLMSAAARNVGASDGVEAGSRPPHSVHQQPVLSEKEKFERILAGLPPDPSPLPPDPSPLPPANPAPRQTANSRLGRTQGQGSKGVTVDLVGEILRQEPSTAFANQPLEGDELGDLDNLDNLQEMMEGLDFDIDGFLDLDQFDFDEDFLEKGWRPQDTPQMPHNYPVLARISSGNSMKPPLPPVMPPPGEGARLGGLVGGRAPFQSPSPPPHQPMQAWNYAESLGSEGGGGGGYGGGPPPPRVPPLLRPPSSLASGEDSQAMTTGGRSKKGDQLAQEWGFKDNRTAEMMMQRAKKMKYNSERRKKLSKLDPQQRLRLFRKLEEVRGIDTVRPPPQRVLPRKEYFQAREDEAQQREVERHQEHRTKVGRTFEWLHTQVGDHNVASSRINPGPAGAYHSEGAPVKLTSDTQMSHYAHFSPGPSPVSLELESASYASGQRSQPSTKRHSVPGEDLSMTGHGAMFPPIKPGSASSQQSREREKMSWRTEPAQQNVGWGGGKKRAARK